MRRTIGVVAGACTVLALASAGATAYARTERSAAVGAWQASPADVPPGTPAAAAAAPPAAAAAKAARGVRPQPATEGSAAPLTPGRERIGSLESVRRLLGYRDTAESTTLHYPGASYVKVHFDRLLMLPGDHVTVADPKGTEVHRYEAAPLPGLGDVAGLGGLADLPALRALADRPLDPGARWAMSVTGDTAVVTLHRSRPNLPGLDDLLDRLGVGIDQVARGYTDPERRRAAADARPAPTGPAGPGREESICGGDEKADAVCYRSADPIAYTRSKAVARLLINGVELCTGWRVGTNNRMLTNNHCFTSSAEAYQSEVWFNYQCAVCGGYDLLRPTKVWGDRVLTTDRDLDFTLFTVENFDLVSQFGFLEFDPRRPVAGDELYVPQHPSGDPTMIAMSGPGRAGNCAVADPRYDGYATDSDVSYYCDTEGGSSGSPVLSRDSDRVVALHHFGGCPNSGVRGDLVYERIRAQL